ncbi:hypothetical protein [Limnochorda pilosa]|uniref:Cytochrome b/b6 C-terminal region profile domain-containing protein n=1 Tax=Limnochorda pilosa TaxID=1555112 RepID=A0A0K2SJC0_LIMPI|nr:hypothetical protein [Limnochorda pilosa]BAS27193.1 hypothetical protein LIP_1342 [Limnochorda pilosa]
MSVPRPQPRKHPRPAPHPRLPFARLAAREWVAALAALDVLVLLAIFLIPGLDPAGDAPAAGGAPSPAGAPAFGGHAPWVFASIQFLLRRLPSWLAGVVLPIMGLLVLAALPRLERWLRRDAGWVGLGLVGLAALLTVAAALGLLG